MNKLFNEKDEIKRIVNNKKTYLIMSILFMVVSVSLVVLSFLFINKYSEFLAIVISSVFSSLIIALIVFITVYIKYVDRVKYLYYDAKDEYTYKNYKFIRHTHKRFTINYIAYYELIFEDEDGIISLMLNTSIKDIDFKENESYKIYAWKSIITGVDQ